MLIPTAFVFLSLWNHSGTVAIRSVDVLDLATPADGKGCAVLLDGHDLDTYLSDSCDQVKIKLKLK